MLPSARYVLVGLALVCTYSVQDARGQSDEMNTAEQFDPAPAWPLCGRIAENPPRRWQPRRGCPSERWGDAGFSDFPINSTFGPRRFSTSNDRFDFHRGIDLETPVGTPVFAISRGIVIAVGNHPSHSDPIIVVRHFRPGAWEQCSPGGCYHALYLHVSSWVVSEGQEVAKGQLLGYTGASDSGFAHLHFEIRDARPEDPASTWQQDAIHPLRVLPYNAAIESTQVSIEAVNTTNPLHPAVTVKVRQPASARSVDLARIEVKVYDNLTQQLIVQPGEIADVNGYYVYPPFFDVELQNRLYTHKDSASAPWSSFSICPFADVHPASYDPDVHLSAEDAADPRIGAFNGMRVQPSLPNTPTADYELRITFTELIGVLRAQDVCVVAVARMVSGAQSTPVRWNCTFSP